MARKRPVSEILDRLPPCDEDAEMGLLCSLMQDPARRDEVRGMLWPDAFYVDAHRILYQYLLEMDAFDMTLLLARLRIYGQLEAVGGPAYLAEVLASEAIPNHAAHYAWIVVETAKKREMLAAGIEALRELYSGEGTVSELAKRHANKLLAIANRKGEPCQPS